jgi:phosphoenolpyruvate carboxykinase (ATP)
MGVTDPEATFSPCFGGPFLVWHPAKYAELLAKRIEENDAAVWLVNTGWSGGSFGVGSRMKLKFTRAIIDGIHSGELRDSPTVTDATFGFEIPITCTNVPDEIMQPRNTWADKAAFDATQRKLGQLFIENFKQFEAGASDEVRAAGPA